MATAPEPNPRYTNRPLVAFAEFYVLWVIGELDPVREGAMKKAGVALRAQYGGSEWHDSVAAILGLTPAVAPEIKQMWRRNTETARAAGVVLSPQQFAEMFVDSNFFPPGWDDRNSAAAKQ